MTSAFVVVVPLFFFLFFFFLGIFPFTCSWATDLTIPGENPGPPLGRPSRIYTEVPLRRCCESGSGCGVDRVIPIRVSAEQDTEFCLSWTRLLCHLHTRREHWENPCPFSIYTHYEVWDPMAGMAQVWVFIGPHHFPLIRATGGVAEAPWLGPSRQGISQGRVRAWSKRGAGCQRSSLEVSRAAFYFCRSFYMQRRILKVDFWINLRLFGVLRLK